MNKYTTWYKNITKNAKNRSISGYTEKHHIIPKSLGGSDSDSNIVKLTAREHFICHWLLTKTTTGTSRQKMIYALRVLRANNPHQQRHETKITSRVYENIKKEYSEIASKQFSGEGNGMYGKTHTNEAKQRISEANKGRVQPQKEKQKQIQAMTGKKRAQFSDEWKDNLSNNHKSKSNDFNGKHSEETKRKIGDAMRGKKRDPLVSEQVAQKLRGLKRTKKQCPHCNKMIAVNTYPRWHGDNCKLKV